MNVHEAKQKLDDIHEVMLKRAKEPISASNFKGSHCVQVIDKLEGTVLFYESAFAVQYDNYVFVVTEHHESSFYHEDDVIIREYERLWGDISNRLPWEPRS